MHNTDNDREEPPQGVLGASSRKASLDSPSRSTDKKSKDKSDRRHRQSAKSSTARNPTKHKPDRSSAVESDSDSSSSSSSSDESSSSSSDASAVSQHRRKSKHSDRRHRSSAKVNGRVASHKDETKARASHPRESQRVESRGPPQPLGSGQNLDQDLEPHRVIEEQSPQDNNQQMAQQVQALQLQVSQLLQQLSLTTPPPVPYTYPHSSTPYTQPVAPVSTHMVPGACFGALPQAPGFGTPHIVYNIGSSHPPQPPSKARKGPPNSSAPNNLRSSKAPPPPASDLSVFPPPPPPVQSGSEGGRKIIKLEDSKPSPSKPEFKRVDWIWDKESFTYKLQDTVETAPDQYGDYIFHVRRIFDPDGKYMTTIVDIKSKVLRDCLQEVIGDIKGVSLVDETPKMDPQLLFLYLDDFREHVKKLKEEVPTGEKARDRKSSKKLAKQKRLQLKLLVEYIEVDFARTKESLDPMLENGLITFDLLWALWKPHTLGVSPTYGSSDELRVFKVEIAERLTHMMKGPFYNIVGKFLEHDGKSFGYGTFSSDIPKFTGARKITSLDCYPLSYHRNEPKLRKELIDRGKKFVALSGAHYKAYSGIAYMKRKKAMIKFNIQHSRIMADPSTFRRVNPNYNPPGLDLKGRGGDDGDDSDKDSDSSRSDGDHGIVLSSEGGIRRGGPFGISGSGPKFIPVAKGDLAIAAAKGADTEDEPKLDAIKSNEGDDGGKEKETDEETNKKDGTKAAASDVVKSAALEFTEEDYLIASPIILGFAFSEKQWLEFLVSGVKDIEWNDDAWDSLVLEPATKDLIQALVKSRKYHAARTIDDVVQGKGKGLVTVLHGPPGTGKTLTAEGISELLRCPLYVASAGELSTDSRYLEVELQRILDVCHTWGAILLLDEADVFLEKRNMHEIQRNALVSIFLRQLEYFQGILFLTTNRVETFDEAFQSRIHVALRYDTLDIKAKRTIFKFFIERVRALGELQVADITEAQYDMLAKKELNGREIKNVVGSAQDLAVNKGEMMGMKHIQQVLDVHVKFGRDLKGGTGYEDAMRSYF